MIALHPHANSMLGLGQEHEVGSQSPLPSACVNHHPVNRVSGQLATSP